MTLKGSALILKQFLMKKKLSRDFIRLRKPFGISHFDNQSLP